MSDERQVSFSLSLSHTHTAHADSLSFFLSFSLSLSLSLFLSLSLSLSLSRALSLSLSRFLAFSLSISLYYSSVCYLVHKVDACRVFWACILRYIPSAKQRKGIDPMINAHTVGHRLPAAVVVMVVGGWVGGWGVQIAPGRKLQNAGRTAGPKGLLQPACIGQMIPTGAPERRAAGAASKRHGVIGIQNCAW